MVLVIAFLAITSTELMALVTFTDYADDRIYFDRAFSRLLNSGIRFDPRSKGFSKRFGFVLSPNSEWTEITKEFTYMSRTNSLGFRAKEIVPKRPREYRVMLLGDSMFWGIGVKDTDTISSVMETLAGSTM